LDGVEESRDLNVADGGDGGMLVAAERVWMRYM
jgi:hypothetical protein